MSDFNPYKILGVDRDAGLPVIKAAYRKRSKETHPDIAGDGGRDEFELVNRSWNILSDPVSRKLFDENGIIDKDSPERLRKGVSDFIVSVFDKCLDQAFTNQEVPVDQYDFIGFMRFSTKKIIEEAKVDADSVKKRIHELGALKKRIRRSGDFDNVFSMRLDERIIATSADLKQLEGNIMVMENAMVELENYTTEADLMRTFYTTSSSASTAGGGFGWR